MQEARAVDQVVDQVRKELPEGDIVVVTGAYHSVALPFTSA